MASNLHKSVEEMSHCILAVTREIQVLSFLSASYAPLDYASLSPFTLFSTLFNFFRLTPGKTFHFLMETLNFPDSNPSAGLCRNEIKI